MPIQPEKFEPCLLHKAILMEEEWCRGYFPFLTPKEKEIVCAMRDGATPQEIHKRFGGGAERARMLERFV